MSVVDARFAPAQPADLGPIGALLERSALPGADLTPAHLQHFWVLRDEDGLAGVVGLEPRGSAALLRSLAVREDLRGRGLGGRLVTEAESQAAALGVETLYLLTTTSERFFAAHGYRPTPRDSAPAGVRATREFSELCPSNSACMSKRVGR